MYIYTYGYMHINIYLEVCAPMQIQDGEDLLGTLSLQVIFRKRAL